MNLQRKIKYVFLLTLLYEFYAEAKSKKSEKPATELRKSKQKGKKQFFPIGQGYPSPYLMPQLKPADSTSEVKFAKGFPVQYDCTRSKYGCCWDGRTPAHGEAGKGCPQCRDVYEDFCKKTKDLCHFPMIADYCRITCKLCSKNKKNSCQKAQYNCCWDGKTAAEGPNLKGCPSIKDKLARECEKFEAECLRNPYYMWTKCRETCLRYLPPIEPYLQRLRPSNDQSPSPPLGQPWIPPAARPPTGPSFPYPFPSSPQGNNTLGKKTSARNKPKGTL